MEHQEHHHQKNSSEAIMAALSTLTPTEFSNVTHNLSSDFRLKHHCLRSLLISTTRFSATLCFLNSLSLHQKTLLIARYLLTTLSQLTLTTTNAATVPGLIGLRYVDAALLLMLLCEVSQHDPCMLETPQSNWRRVLRDYTCNNMLTISGMAVSNGAILSKYIDIATRCRRFLNATGCSGGEKERGVAASASAVVSLPSVEVRPGGGVECVICKEEMRAGRDVCQLPCQHLFHWMCVLPWLKNRNTCPCCRFQLPTDDVFGEIERLWVVLVKMLVLLTQTSKPNPYWANLGPSKSVRLHSSSYFLADDI